MSYEDLMLVDCSVVSLEDCLESYYWRLLSFCYVRLFWDFSSVMADSYFFAFANCSVSEA